MQVCVRVFSISFNQFVNLLLLLSQPLDLLITPEAQ